MTVTAAMQGVGWHSPSHATRLFRQYVGGIAAVGSWCHQPVRSGSPPRSQAKGRAVAGIESEVLDTFLAELTSVDGVPSQVSEGLATLLASDKLPKSDQLVALYTDASGESAL